jgi:hypothetical protein
MAINRTPPLEERIESLRAEADAATDLLVEAERKRLEGGLPSTMVRALMTKGAVDPLEAYLNAKREADALVGSVA